MRILRLTTPGDPHRGRGMKGRTPAEVFKAGKRTRKPSARKEVKNAA